MYNCNNLMEVVLVCNGYLSLEYAMQKQLLIKVGVFSFRIEVLKLVSGCNHFINP